MELTIIKNLKTLLFNLTPYKSGEFKVTGTNAGIRSGYAQMDGECRGCPREPTAWQSYHFSIGIITELAFLKFDLAIGGLWYSPKDRRRPAVTRS
jgi:hypothetical protein